MLIILSSAEEIIQNLIINTLDSKGWLLLVSYVLIKQIYLKIICIT